MCGSRAYSDPYKPRTVRGPAQGKSLRGRRGVNFAKPQRSNGGGRINLNCLVAGRLRSVSLLQPQPDKANLNIAHLPMKDIGEARVANSESDKGIVQPPVMRVVSHNRIQARVSSVYLKPDQVTFHALRDKSQARVPRVFFLFLISMSNGYLWHALACQIELHIRFLVLCESAVSVCFCALPSEVTRQP